MRACAYELGRGLAETYGALLPAMRKGAVWLQTSTVSLDRSGHLYVAALLL